MGILFCSYGEGAYILFCADVPTLLARPPVPLSSGL